MGDVTPLQYGEKHSAARHGSNQAAWIKRQALVVVAQLPDDQDDALLVLEYAKKLITDFIGAD